MSFTGKIEQYTGSNTGLDTTNAIKQAVDITLGTVKSNAPQLLSLFARKVTVSSSMTTGYQLSSEHVFDVTKIEREFGSSIYICQPVPNEQFYAVSDPSSIYYVQGYSPAYLIDFTSRIRIFPDPDNTDKAYMYLVYNSNGKVINDSSETITEELNHTPYGVTTPTTQCFPKVWYQYLILVASSILVQEKISLLMSDTTNSTFTSVEEWLSDEDEGMVTSTAQAIGIFQNKIQIIDKYKQEFLTSQGIAGTSDNPKAGQKS